MSTTTTLAAWPTLGKRLFPGVLASCVVAAAATFLSQHYGAPVMLFALMLGLAMNFLADDGPCVAGIQWTAQHVLRIGVALLGLRITAAQVAQMGWHPILMVVATVAATIVLGIVVARLMRFNGLFGLLTGGAVAICGASAAMALAAALPRHPMRERATLFTVIGVSALSTLAMVVYPMIVRALGLGPTQAGIFLGGTIHDVAQVVGAGYGMSTATGDAATLVKLLRVAMLLPVIAVAGMLTRAREGAVDGKRPPILPWFAIAFALLVLVNSSGWLPATLVQGGVDLSQWCLVASIAAIGMKTQLKELLTVGWKPIALMVGETAFLALLVLAWLHWVGGAMR